MRFHITDQQRTTLEHHAESYRDQRKREMLEIATTGAKAAASIETATRKLMETLTPKQVKALYNISSQLHNVQNNMALRYAICGLSRPLEHQVLLYINGIQV